MKNKKTFILSTLAVLLFASCMTTSPELEQEKTEQQNKEEIKPELKPRKSKRTNEYTPEAITKVTDFYGSFKTPGGRVLAVAADLVAKKELILGGCWTYVNAVYDRAGFPADKRETLYKAGQKGPYIDHSLILPGDWIMYCNLPYKEIGHSAIFVEWIDFERRSALTIEYVGGNRKIPGRYREADILKTFGLLRGME
ncbi:MAG: hypothetical protein JXJ04_01315 [Spirochaetales bacterium]|nr:hypothetical protein [Spirochaetales bacterium]